MINKTSLLEKLRVLIVNRSQSKKELLSELKNLQQQIEELSTEKDELELLLKTTTEHADEIAEELTNEKDELELLLETTTEHADQIAEELTNENAELELMLETSTQHADFIADDLTIEKLDLERMIETIIQHSDFVEDELQKKKELIHQLFGRYLSDEVVTCLLENAERIKLGGIRQKVTILTSDLRGFTSLAEEIPAEEVIKILNLYLEYMTDTIIKYQGTINEIMGDGILVYFGAPTVREDDAKRAVACACAMQLAMEEINEKIKEWGFSPLEMGIGINTGEVVVGNIGSEKRAKYTALGSSVNLAFRIESYTTGGQILISESTFKEVGSMLRKNGQMKVRPKGMKEPIIIHDISGIDGKYHLFLAKKEEKFFTLQEAILVQFMLIEGKHISDKIYKGSLVKLSEKGALISYDQFLTPEDLSPFNNIKINLLSNNKLEELSEDIYAKILDKPAPLGSFYICFTSQPPSVRKKLEVALLYNLQTK